MKRTPDPTSFQFDNKVPNKKEELATPIKRTGKRYKSWKGINGVQQAEEIEKRLRLELAREPRKKDFIETGHYNAWMALYRYRNKAKTRLKYKRNLEEVYTDIRSLVVLTKNHELLTKMLEDIINNLGPEKIVKILRAIIEKRNRT